MSLKEILIIVIIVILITSKFKKEYFTDNLTCNKKIDNLKKLKYFQNKNNKKIKFEKNNTFITNDSNPDIINREISNRWLEDANININSTNKPCNNKKIKLEEINNSESKNCPGALLDDLCQENTGGGVKKYFKYADK